MSARALPAWTFAPAIDYRAPENLTAEFRFREDLWRAYRREALDAGLSAAQASEYATALSSATGLVAGVPEMAPAERGWFYQSRPEVAWRTIASGLIRLSRRDQSNAAGRSAAASVSIIARGFRWWNAGGKS